MAFLGSGLCVLLLTMDYDVSLVDFRVALCNNVLVLMLWIHAIICGTAVVQVVCDFR